MLIWRESRFEAATSSAPRVSAHVPENEIHEVALEALRDQDRDRHVEWQYKALA